LSANKRIINIGVIVIIIAMSAFVYFEIDRIFDFIRLNFFPSERWRTPNSATPMVSNEIKEIKNPEQPKKMAPDFELEDLEGRNRSLSEFRGQSVMINFWAIWCPPCRAELPLIQAYADKFNDKLVVLAINAGEEKSNVQHFVNEFDYNLVFLLDPENIAANHYKIRGLPTSVFIDEQGYWLSTHIGELDNNLLSNYLEKIGVTQ